VRIKLDENFGSRTAEVFRAAGHEVATAIDEQLQSASDDDVFAACVRERRVLVTLDLDFANPLRFDPATAAGVAVLRVPSLPGRRHLIAAAMRVVAAMQEGDITGRLWVVDMARVRQYNPEDLRRPQ
jgi:predicted nuclease of predicted toxin-antitoxin system